jgi:hypothetical protein
MYDPTANLSSGGFSVTGSALVTTQASGYLGQLYAAGASGWLSSDAIILNSSSSQDQIARVSEPSTLMLMSLAFFGFASLVRKRAKAR